MSYTTVITSINPVNEVTRAWAKVCAGSGGQLVVVGDKKSPSTYDLPGCKFISYLDKLDGIKSCAVTPLNSYARKNLGYLWAFSQKTGTVYETDDDNAPLDTWMLREEVAAHTRIEGPKGSWFNSYRYAQENAWPRGFSLSKINSPSTFTSSDRVSRCPVQQGMIRGDSDVDAIYRLTRGSELSFSADKHYALNGPWCPFNSQSTWWWPEAYVLMYLPVTCSMRVTDIWRSFVAQRCLRAAGLSVLYHSPAEVVQVRNTHNLLNDFEQEIGLYLHADLIAEGLDSLNLNACLKSSMRECYEFFISKKLLQPTEMVTLNAWIEDCDNLC